MEFKGKKGEREIDNEEPRVLLKLKKGNLNMNFHFCSQQLRCSRGD